MLVNKREKTSPFKLLFRRLFLSIFRSWYTMIDCIIRSIKVVHTFNKELFTLHLLERSFFDLTDNFFLLLKYFYRIIYVKLSQFNQSFLCFRKKSKVIILMSIKREITEIFFLRGASKSARTMIHAEKLVRV